MAYSFTPRTGFADVRVMPDGVPVPAAGSVVMNRDRTLMAVADNVSLFPIGIGAIQIITALSSSVQRGDGPLFVTMLDRLAVSLPIAVPGDSAPRVFGRRLAAAIHWRTR